MNLDPTEQKFVMHFGEMGSRWGINRTVGQIYALLYLSPAPLNAEDICDKLGFSRSNVSMGLKELDSWQLIRLKHLPGDRRDYFTTPDDIWEIVRTLIEQRRQREIEPTLTMLRDVLMDPPCKESEGHAHKHQRMQEMHDLILMLTDWYEDMKKMETERLVHLMKLGTKVYKLYEMKDKLSVIPGAKKEQRPKMEHTLDPFMLSRMQFAANITFHILFPTITIAMGWILLFFKLRYQFTKDETWMDAYFFWTKIFALCFAMGVVSGITMSFQFGTNWPGFMETVGNIAGPLLAYEVLTAFFLEATFLGVMLFGFRRVPAWLHNLATFLVAFGTTASAFWILVLNSWMHTPTGFEMIDGQAHATDWMAIIWNPSFPYRFVHMLLASGLTASFLVAGISAYRLIKKDTSACVMKALKTGVVIAALLIPVQIFVGDMHGLNTLEHQPQKVAAMEANWETQGNVPLILFAIPDEEERTNHFAIEVPNLASLILTHHADGEVPGLNDYVGEHPPVAPVFFSFRIMVGLGILMLLVSWSSAAFLLMKKELPVQIQYALVAMTFSGWVATIAGWYVTEIGRQPYLVQGLLLTKDAVADLPPSMVGLTLTAYLIVYFVLLTAFITTVFHLAKKAGEGGKYDPQKNKALGIERRSAITAAE